MPRRRPRPIALAAPALALALAACGPVIGSIDASVLASVRTDASYPIYWVGQAFEGSKLLAISQDPSGAYDIQYGPCTRGYDTCTAPLTVVTVPDPGFVPGEPHGHRTGVVRGVNYFSAEGGQTLQIVTGRVVINIFARTATEALAAAIALRPIQDDAVTRGPLPAPQRGPAPGGPVPVGLPTTTTTSSTVSGAGAAGDSVSSQR